MSDYSKLKDIFPHGPVSLTTTEEGTVQVISQRSQNMSGCKILLEEPGTYIFEITGRCIFDIPKEGISYDTHRHSSDEEDQDQDQDQNQNQDKDQDPDQDQDQPSKRVQINPYVHFYIGTYPSKTLLYDTFTGLTEQPTTFTHEIVVKPNTVMEAGLLFNKPVAGSAFEVISVFARKTIKHVYVSTVVSGLAIPLCRKYEFTLVTGQPNQPGLKNLPALFFGIYNKTDRQKLTTILKNPDTKVKILWGGSDILAVSKDTQSDILDILSNPNVTHLAVSSDIEEDLKMLNLTNYERINFTLISPDTFKILPSQIQESREIYVYMSADPEHYGAAIIKELKAHQKMRQFSFIMGNPGKYSQQELSEIYNRCFIGLRLTSHDGYASTVQEMGLCGISCIHNGDMPNAIRWGTESQSVLEDIVEKILYEFRAYSQDRRHDIRKITLRALRSDNGWLYV